MFFVIDFDDLHVDYVNLLVIAGNADGFTFFVTSNTVVIVDIGVIAHRTTGNAVVTVVIDVIPMIIACIFVNFGMFVRSGVIVSNFWFSGARWSSGLQMVDENVVVVILVYFIGSFDAGNTIRVVNVA